MTAKVLNRTGLYFLSGVNGFEHALSELKPAYVVIHVTEAKDCELVKKASPHTKIIGRLYKSDQDYDHNIQADPIGFGKRVATELKHTDWAHLCDGGIITSNEVCMRWDQLDALNQYYLSLQDNCSYPLALYSCAVENLPWTDNEPILTSLMKHWQKLYPSMRAGHQHGDILAIHQYNSPEIWLDDMILNHNRMVRYEELVWPHLPPDLKKLPVVVSEWGIDHLLWPTHAKGGWLYKNSPYSAQDVLSQIRGFYALWDKDYSDRPIKGWVYYCVGDSGGWGDYSAERRKDGVSLLDLIVDKKPGGTWHPGETHPAVKKDSGFTPAPATPPVVTDKSALNDHLDRMTRQVNKMREIVNKL